MILLVLYFSLVYNMVCGPTRKASANPSRVSIIPFSQTHDIESVFEAFFRRKKGLEVHPPP